jgi:hypothetical protein
LKEGKDEEKRIKRKEERNRERKNEGGKNRVKNSKKF